MPRLNTTDDLSNEEILSILDDGEHPVAKGDHYLLVARKNLGQPVLEQAHEHACRLKPP